MKKVFLFGTGWCAKFYFHKVKLALESLGNYEIIGFLDNDRSKTGTKFEGYPIDSPHILKNCSCDLVLLFLMDEINYIGVFEQLSQMVPSHQIQNFDFPLKLLIQKRYENSEDKEIRELLQYITSNKLTCFNQFIKAPHTYNEVKWDSDVDLPYIDFMTIEGKKIPMYYPRNYSFIKKDNILYVRNLLWEQSPGSPHLYVKPGHDVEDGDCIIDAGVCEGNFALKYVDVASHLYLFEMDPVWQEPLHYTFRNYEKKVTIINKALSDKTTNKTCRLDDVIAEQKINFIKMDIEGSELAALHGAERTFCRNTIKSSVCSYHRNGDERKIRLFLEKFGYHTMVSDGFMLFLFSDDTWKLGDLRRGIVYGSKQ